MTPPSAPASPPEIRPDAPTRPGFAFARTRPVWVQVLAVSGFLALVIALAALGGYRAGLSDRNLQMAATARQNAHEQYVLSEQDLIAGRFELARQRLTFILGIDPQYPGAAQALATAERGLAVTPTPTASATPAASPTAAADTPAEWLAHAETRAAAGDWPGVLQALDALRSLDPAYEAVRADGLRYKALLGRGVAQIKAGALELGLYDLAQAEQIGPLDADAAGYQLWAELYLAGDSYWGLNWERASYYYGQLYLSAPYFLDTYQRYAEALRRYGDLFSAAGNACAAQEQYRLSRRILPTPDPFLIDSLATAQAVCALATATPTLTPTPEPSATATLMP